MAHPIEETIPTKPIKVIAIEKLKPYELNAKEHPQSQIEGIANSIKRFGFRGSILITRDYVIVCGHGTVRGAMLAGLTHVPCEFADDMSEQEIKAFRIIHNKLAETGWDNKTLALDLQSHIFDYSPFNIDLSHAAEVDFQPSDIDEQGKLDEKQKVICPNCQHEFYP